MGQKTGVWPTEEDVRGWASGLGFQDWYKIRFAAGFMSSSVFISGSYGCKAVLREAGHGCSPTGLALSLPSPVTAIPLGAPGGPDDQWYGLGRTGTAAV